MFADFLRRLGAPDPETVPQPDARRALTALLVRLARADNHYAPAERTRIEAIAMRRYGLDAAAATALREEGEALEAEAPDTVRFTRAIKDKVAYEDRIEVVEALWELALADGDRAEEEDALLRLVTSLLGISDTDSAMARQRVAARE